MDLVSLIYEILSKQDKEVFDEEFYKEIETVAHCTYDDILSALIELQRQGYVDIYTDDSFAKTDLF